MAIPIAAVTAMAEGAYRARDGKGDAALIEALAQRCEGEVKKGVLTGTHRGTELVLRFLPQQQSYEVSVGCPLAGRFRVTRKGSLDRRMEGFVPARKFHSYDSRFDRDFNVQTRDPELTSAILTKKPNRVAVRTLFDRGVQAVHLDGDRVKAVGQRKSLGPKPTVEDILRLVDGVAVVAASVRAFAKHHELRPAPKNDPLVVASWIVLGVLGVAGFIMLIAGSVELTLVRPVTFLPVVLASFLPVPLIVFGFALIIQGRTSPYGLLRGLAGVSLVCVPLFLSGGLLLANGLLDGSAPEQHDVSVVGKRAKEDDDGDMKYYAGLEAWWTADDVRWVRVSKKTFDALVPSESRMNILTRPGKLGFEWIEDYSIVQ